MKIFVDTNVIISALITTAGTSADVIKYCIRSSHSLHYSPYVLKEVEKTLTKKIRISKADVKNALSFIKKAMVQVPDVTLDKKVSRDSKDDPILAAAKKAGVDCILTGDKDLLELKKFETIVILPPGEFYRFAGA